MLTMPKVGRVLTLNDGHRVPHRTSGAYADIFIDENAARVYKLFIAEPEGRLPRSLSTANLNAIRRENFQTQLNAYRIAEADPFLSAHIPQFFGTAQATAVHDSAGADVSNEYLLDACYVVQRLEGRDEKANPRSDFAPAHIKAFAKRCKTLGINYVHDSSAFNLEDPERFVVIDFATREIEMPW
jgi:hypothetical protein